MGFSSRLFECMYIFHLSNYFSLFFLSFIFYKDFDSTCHHFLSVKRCSFLSRKLQEFCLSDGSQSLTCRDKQNWFTTFFPSVSFSFINALDELV